KHGPIALVDKETPVVCICPKDSVYSKMLSNMEEVKSRGGKIIAVATEGDEKVSALADEVFFVPETIEDLTPLLTVIPLQLLAHHIAMLRGLDVDRPRNLAKSVTVE
ncbi:MAG TPA: SIS domain-containing protein, partial [Armatimonadetes bacterium]|nr:SIS domain-containing protein [Armatimonadota bacterium]